MNQKSQDTQNQHNFNSEHSISYPEVCVVEASAGSGKTYALASRYLKLLLNPRMPINEIILSNILSMTFTNKAALEMKTRILEFLKKLALDKFANQQEKDNLLQSLGIDSEFARQKSFLVMDYIIKNYNYFQVQTIDSFINSILSGCAFKLDLSADFRIKTDHRQQLAYSFDNLIDEAAKDNQIMSQFLKFLENYIYLENKKSWMPKQDILDIMEILLNAKNSFGLNLKKSSIELEVLRNQKEKIKALMLELKKILPAEVNLIYWSKFVKDFNSDISVGKLEDFFNPFSKSDLMVKKGFIVSDEVFGLWKTIKDNIEVYCVWQSVAMFNCYVDIFDGVLKKFNELSKFEDIIFLEELNKQAQSLFQNELEIVPEIYYRLATTFRHFLIDEFQDTSNLQWGNLQAMVVDSLSRGGTLFYVGDKKQAIYRFRGGDVRLFDQLKSDLQSYNVKTRLLSYNFRSQKTIVEFNNSVFSVENLKKFNFLRQENQKTSLFLSENDVSDIAAIFDNSKQEYRAQNDKGYVKIEKVDIDKKEELEDYIKEKLDVLINQLQSRFSNQNIAVLCRSNSEVEMITSWLLDKKLPVESEKTLNIRENPLVKEIIAFLKFLNSPIDDLSFATFILGDIFSKASGISKHEIQDFLFNNNKQKSKSKHKLYLYRYFRIKYPIVWENFIEDFYKTVGFVPLYELMISILSRFQIMKNFSLSQGFILKLLEVIKQQESDNQSISYFLDYFDRELAENLYVNVANKDSIKVITVHKSKGLEFDVVVIPFFEMDVKVGSGNSKNRTFIFNTQPDYLELRYIKKDSSLDFSNELRDIYTQEFKKSMLDELNNLYVACTRAKKELYVFIPKKTSNSNNIARFLLNTDIDEFGQQIEYDQTRKLEENIIKKLEVNDYRDWVEYLKDEFLSFNQIVNRDSIIKGDCLHYVLSFMDNIKDKDINEFVDKAINKAKNKFKLFKEWDFIENKVKTLLSDTRFINFFNLEKTEVYIEKEFVDHFGHTKRMDRVLITDKQITIIDYKSSTQGKEEYYLQLKEYALILKEIYSQKHIKCFLIYLDNLDLDEVLWQE